ncbi:hypothetical protein [Megasphaera hominis]|jgi:hypothetical protein|uniref:Uncharacterized protein n=1 Tax=Megasphaera hominis TaxID=159836 RepID=A0ABR6VJ76_9FIRM|nr:hypothetical protein [Megasphaera hominis]MBC3537342.1 hypothetical protein [Megasphaera hominis]
MVEYNLKKKSDMRKICTYQIDWDKTPAVMAGCVEWRIINYEGCENTEIVLPVSGKKIDGYKRSYLVARNERIEDNVIELYRVIVCTIDQAVREVKDVIETGFILARGGTD